MFYLCFLVLALSESNISQNYITLSEISPPSASAEENRRATLITEYTHQKIDQCYDNLGRTLNDLCINLDADKRKRLAIAIMICEQKRDGREDSLPLYYDSDASFILSLDPESFNMFTTYFINIDTICFHAVRENISSSNMQKILSVFQAVSLSAEFLANARKNLDELMAQAKSVYQQYQILFEMQTLKFQSIQNSIIQMIQTVKLISEKVMMFKYFASNAKLYAIILMTAFVINLILPNVFLPILFIIGLFLFIEISANDDKTGFVTHFSFKLILIFLCLIVVSISAIEQFQLLKKKEPKKKLNSKLRITGILVFEKSK